MMNADNKRTAKEPMKGKAYPFRSDGITATSAPPIAGAGMAVSVVATKTTHNRSPSLLRGEVSKQCTFCWCIKLSDGNPYSINKKQVNGAFYKRERAYSNCFYKKAQRYYLCSSPCICKLTEWSLQQEGNDIIQCKHNCKYR